MKLSIIFSVMLCFVLGCEPAYDVDSMLLLKMHRIDYKKFVDDGKAREEAVAWAQSDCITRSPSSDLTRLMRAIGEYPFLIIKHDASSEPLIHALAAAHALGAANFGKTRFEGMIGPNTYELYRAKYEFNMSDSEFNRFVLSRATRIMNIDEYRGKEKIFVLFAAGFDERMPIEQALDIIFSHGAHVILVTPRPERFRGELFVPNGLSLEEGICIANHLLGNRPALTIERHLISEPLIKAIAALDSLTIGSIRAPVIDVKARVQQARAKTPSEMLPHLLGALEIRSIPVDLMGSTSLMTDDVNTVERNLKLDRFFYRKDRGQN